MLCHRVVFDPCVSLFSVTEGRSRSLSLCSTSSTASLFRGSPNHHVVQPVDSCVGTHAPLRGPLVHPALLAGFRVSRIATVTRYFPSRVLMARVSLLHAGATRDCEFCCAQSFFWVCVRLSFDLALCLVVSGHASTQTCAQGIDRPTCLVEPSCSKISHSCFPHVWHHLLGCPSRLFFVNLGSLSAFLFALRLCPSCS